MHEQPARYLTPKRLHTRLCRAISVRTLANWRCLGVEPKFTKVGGRVLYPIAEVEHWETSRTVESTSNYVRTA